MVEVNFTQAMWRLYVGIVWRGCGLHGGLTERQAQFGPGSACGAITDVNLAPMQQHHLAHQRESEPGTLLPTVGARQGVETFEDALLGIIGNARPLIIHR